MNTNLLGALRGVEMALKHATRSLTRRAPRPVLIAVTSSSNGIVPADSDFAPVCAPPRCRRRRPAGVSARERLRRIAPADVATKFGINGAVRAMAPFGERFGVRVNAIAPVAVDTPMVQALGLNDEARHPARARAATVTRPSARAAMIGP